MKVSIAIPCPVCRSRGTPGLWVTSIRTGQRQTLCPECDGWSWVETGSIPLKTFLKNLNKKGKPK